MKSTVSVYLPDGVDAFSHHTSRPKAARVTEYLKTIRALIGGGINSRSSNGVSTRPSLTAGLTHARGTVTAATVLATNTVTINGQIITAVTGTAAIEEFDRSGTDIVTASNLAAAINGSAQTLITGLVRAGNLAGTVTCATALAGSTVKVAGVTFTAVGAASADPTHFLITGDDTADAAALVVCINAHPTTKQLVLATNASGVVTIRQLPFGPNVGHRLSSSDGTTLAVSGAALAATAVVLVCAASKGVEGNQTTLASSGATLTVSAARLTGGTSSTLTF